MTWSILLAQQRVGYGRQQTEVLTGNLCLMISRFTQSVRWRLHLPILKLFLPVRAKVLFVQMFPLAMGFGSQPMEVNRGSNPDWKIRGAFRGSLSILPIRMLFMYAQWG